MITRRALVGVLILGWLVLVSPYPESLASTGIILVVLLAAFDVVLGVSTGWLAFARHARLDERETALRDRAYRIAFRLIAVGVLVLIGLGLVGGFLLAVRQQGSAALQAPDPIGARRIIALLELLIILPTAVIAWVQPDRLDDSFSPRQRRGRALRRWTPAVAIPLLGILWLVAVTILPVRAWTVRQVPSNNFSSSDATCGEFAASRDAGDGFGGSVRMRAAVCWNGSSAWVYGDPGLPIPASVPSHFDTHAAPYLTSCAIEPRAADFASVRQTCAIRFGADGTMYLTVRGRVAPGLGSFAARDTTIELDVAPDGRVLTFG